MFLSINRENEKVSCIIVHAVNGMPPTTRGDLSMEGKKCFIVSSPRDGLDGESRWINVRALDS